MKHLIFFILGLQPMRISEDKARNLNRRRLKKSYINLCLVTREKGRERKKRG